nr:hypothetical protein Q903MT_gene3537 [Picea sitchensis]
MYVGRPIAQSIGSLVSQNIIDRLGLASQEARKLARHLFLLSASQSLLKQGKIGQCRNELKASKHKGAQPQSN